VHEPPKLTQAEMQAMMDAIARHHEVLDGLRGRRDRRYALRAGVYAVITYAPTFGPQRSITPVLRDVSAHGLSALHAGAIDTGQAAVCVFVNGERQPLLRAQAKVVRSRPVRGIVHEVAFEFTTPIDLSQVAALDRVTPHPAHPSIDPRAAQALASLSMLAFDGTPIQDVIAALERARSLLIPGTSGELAPREAAREASREAPREAA